MCSLPRGSDWVPFRVLIAHWLSVPQMYAGKRAGLVVQLAQDGGVTRGRMGSKRRDGRQQRGRAGVTTRGRGRNGVEAPADFRDWESRADETPR